MTEKKSVKVHTEIVNGICPDCEEYTMLVGITRRFYRCMSCGSDLEQHVNGKISYLRVITTPPGSKPFVKEWLE